MIEIIAVWIVISFLSVFFWYRTKPVPEKEQEDHKAIDFYGIKLFVPVGYQYITMDRDGELTLHNSKPNFSGNCWFGEDMEVLDTIDPTLIFPIKCETAIMPL